MQGFLRVIIFTCLSMQTIGIGFPAPIESEGVRLFWQWAFARNDSPTAVLHCPPDLFDGTYPIAVLDHWLSSFLFEASRERGGNLDNN